MKGLWKSVMTLIVVMIVGLLIAVVLVSQMSEDNDNPRAQDGVWIVAPTTWETVNETLLLDDADTQHTITGTFYHVTHEGVLYITCAVGRAEDARMRLEIRQDINGAC